MIISTADELYRNLMNEDTAKIESAHLQILAPTHL
jgi:hypothetical protein